MRVFVLVTARMEAPPEGAGNTNRRLTTDYVGVEMAGSQNSRTLSIGARVDRWLRRSVDQFGDCWIWTGSATHNGYGQVMVGHSHVMAHRAFYEYFVTDVPPGLDLDHLCRNRACVNPWHLEPVTRSVNLRRGNTTRTHCSSRTHCPYGHPYDAENTAMRGGHRTCKSCARDRATAARAKKKAAA